MKQNGGIYPVNCDNKGKNKNADKKDINPENELEKGRYQSKYHTSIIRKFTGLSKESLDTRVYSNIQNSQGNNDCM